MKKLLGATLAFGIFATLWVGLHPLFAQTTPAATPPTAVACAFNSPLLTASPTGSAIWVQCDSQGRLLITGGGTSTNPSVTILSGASSTIHDCGGSIATGGTAQQAITSVQYLHGFLLQVGINDSNTDPIYFSDTTITPGAGVAGSFSLNPSTSISAGGSFSSPSNYPVGSAIYVNGATTGDKFKCRYW